MDARALWSEVGLLPATAPPRATIHPERLASIRRGLDLLTTAPRRAMARGR